MKKEITFVVAMIMFALAYGLDFIAGPVSIAVKDPVSFLSTPVISLYPLTAAAVLVRTIAIAATVAVILAVTSKKYFVKAVVVLFLGLIAEFYAIQQLATGVRTTPIQWTLSIAYAGGIMFLFIVIYFLLGIISTIQSSMGSGETKEFPKPLLSEDEGEEQEE